MDSGPRGVTPSRRRSGSRISSSGERSLSSAPRPWKSTKSPSGSDAAGRTRCSRESGLTLLISPAPPIGLCLRLARRSDRAPGERKRGQDTLELRAHVLELRRERKRLAEMLERLIGGEAGAERCDLEQYAARLSEVDGAEIEAVDDRGWAPSALDHPLSPCRMIVHRRCPGDVVDRAGAAPAPGGRPVIGIERAAAFTPYVVAVRARGSKPERPLEEGPAPFRVGAVGANAVEALDRQPGRNLGMPGNQRGVAGLDDAQLEPEPLGIIETATVAFPRGAHALAAPPLLPEAERLGRSKAPHDAVHHSRAGPAALDPRVFEKGEIGAGAAVLIGVEKMVDGRIVLVDRFLDQPQAEHPRVKIHVPRRVARDRGNVMDPVECHRFIAPPCASEVR